MKFLGIVHIILRADKFSIIPLFNGRNAFARKKFGALRFWFFSWLVQRRSRGASSALISSFKSRTNEIAISRNVELVLPGSPAACRSQVSLFRPRKLMDCRAWAEQNYSMDRIGKMYEEYFQRVHRVYEEGWYQENNERQELDWLKRYYPASR
jgi:hypothetical protein